MIGLLAYDSSKTPLNPLKGTLEAAIFKCRVLILSDLNYSKQNLIIEFSTFKGKTQLE